MQAAARNQLSHDDKVALYFESSNKTSIPRVEQEREARLLAAQSRRRESVTREGKNTTLLHAKILNNLAK
jgi:hypothetical protein